MFSQISNLLNSIFVKNIGKKILAIAIAIAIWFVVSIESDVEKNISIDVNYENLPAGLVITNVPQEKINLVVRGPRSLLSSLSPRNFVFAIDLSHISKGLSKFDIRTDQINSPKGIQVTGISPAEIKVDVDDLARKEVKVKPIISPPGKGFEIVGEPGVTPKKVIISGPKSIISKINNISTDMVSTKGEKSKFTIEVPLKTTDRLVKIDGDKTVRVTLDIMETTLEKEFKDIVINFVNFDNLNFEPRGSLKAQLAFEGPYSIINNLNSDDIKVFVDVGDLKNNGKKLQSLKVSVSYPHIDSIKLKKQEPKTLQIKLN
ncbi:MAG: YbbR-like domain-containing protein [Thermodesulfobacteriota bacterium]